MSAENRMFGLVGAEQLLELAASGDHLEPVGNDRPGGYVAGDVIASKYRLVRLIGRGGMGVVWEAHSSALDIRVAIKLIPSTISNSEDQTRLIYEAKAVARLVDPAIVRVFDCGKTFRGEPYVVMELLTGQDLASRLDDRGRLEPIEAVRTLLPIVRALGIAHDANVVHRDVKPENVFLTKTATGEEQPKLLDFGLAKVDLAWDKRLTHAGAAMGSPCYMSPEQARGEEVDRRADLWAFCVVLYETVTGQLPFDGETYNAIMFSILSEPIVSFAELAIDEPALWDIVTRGLERERERRWQSSVELVSALSDWLIERGVLHDLSGVSLHASKNRNSHVGPRNSVRPESSFERLPPRLTSLEDVTLSRVAPVTPVAPVAGARPSGTAAIRSERKWGIIGILGFFAVALLLVIVGFVSSNLSLGGTRARANILPVPTAPTPISTVAIEEPRTAPLAIDEPRTAPLASTLATARPSASVAASTKPTSLNSKPSAKKPGVVSTKEPFKNPFE